jgi:hypothetical protein
MSSGFAFPSGARPLLLVLLLLVSASCSRGRLEEIDPNEGATLVFTNESLAQAELFVVTQGGGARKLATVMAGRTEEVRVPPDIVRRGGLNLVTRLFGRSGTPSSGSLTLRPGDRLTVRLPIDGRSLFVVPATS